MVSLMSLWTFGYLNARLRGLLSLMITRNTILDLLQATKLDEIISIIRTTSYRRYFEALNGFSGEFIEKVLKTHFSDICNSIRRGVRGNLASFLDVVLTRFNSTNLKSILRGIHAGLKQDDVLKYIFPIKGHNLENFSPLLRENTVKTAIEMIKDTKLKKALSEAYPEYHASDNLLILEVVLDQVVYHRLWEEALKWKAHKLFRLNPKFHIKNLVGTEIDLMNMLVTLRCLSLGINPERYLIPIYYRICTRHFPLKSESFEDALVTFLQCPIYGHLFKDLTEKEPFEIVSALETTFPRYYVRLCRDFFNGLPYHCALLYCFLVLKLYEINDLKLVLIGKLEGISPIKIQDHLILYN